MIKQKSTRKNVAADSSYRNTCNNKEIKKLQTVTNLTVLPSLSHLNPNKKKLTEPFINKRKMSSQIRFM